jgi:undecaprenyl-diphosphatase
MTFSQILELDADLSTRLRVAEQPGLLRTIATILAHSGDSWFWFAGLGLLILIGPDSWKYRSLVMFIGTFITAIVVMIIKFTVRRSRPEGEWGQIYRLPDPHSFPSGHATRAMMLGVLAMGLGPAWFGWLLIVWAPLVGLARVSMGVHYLSDIAAGWILGLIMAVVMLQTSPH